MHSTQSAVTTSTTQDEFIDDGRQNKDNNNNDDNNNSKDIESTTITLTVVVCSFTLVLILGITGSVLCYKYKKSRIKLMVEQLAMKELQMRAGEYIFIYTCTLQYTFVTMRE